jgi:hypothetical protein
VSFHREDIGAVDQRLVGIGVIGPDLLDQLILSQHKSNVAILFDISQARKKRAGSSPTKWGKNRPFRFLSDGKGEEPAVPALGGEPEVE